MSRYKTMRQEDIDWMIANYEQYTVDECARELNVSERTVIRWARALELPDKRTMTKRVQDNNLKRKDYVSSVAATQHNIKVGLSVAKVVIEKALQK